MLPDYRCYLLRVAGNDYLTSREPVDCIDDLGERNHGSLINDDVVPLDILEKHPVRVTIESVVRESCGSRHYAALVLLIEVVILVSRKENRAKKTKEYYTH